MTGISWKLSQIREKARVKHDRIGAESRRLLRRGHLYEHLGHALIEHDGKIGFPTMRVQAKVIGNTEGSLAFSEQADTVALFAWLHKDVLIAKLDAEIDAEADDKAALTHEARQQREAEVMGDLLSVERDESELVWRAQSECLPVEHRTDISPLALLSVRLLVTATPKVTGSTAGHS